MATDTIVLKPGRDKSVRARHPWVFSGAISAMPKGLSGELLPVAAADGTLLGMALCTRGSQIVARMLTFDGCIRTPQEIFSKHIFEALQLRQALFTNKPTTAYRLINAEGDGLPGLIVDKYNTALVLQITTSGMERYKELIVQELIQAVHPSWIYEKSTSPSRKEEGLAAAQATLYGMPSARMQIQENGHTFYVSPIEGQKTGFFLDQRNQREEVARYAHGRRVLNCFSYTGGFSIYALAGGALSCDSVDVSAEAIAQVSEHIVVNHLDHIPHQEYVEDVFQFLRRESLPYDFIILDPPAFAKRKSDVMQAARGYKEINRLSFMRLPPRSLLMTSSCSYHVDETLFRQVLFQAALDAGRDVRIIGRHRLAEDHPLNIYHPEGAYIKTCLCYVA